MSVSDRNNSIIEKIKGLLAIADDQKNDEESQTAFIMAQKLMIKYDISMQEVEKDNIGNSRSMDEENVTVFKTLYWWEKELAAIISENFKVKWYMRRKLFHGESRVKRRIMFFGYDSDVELAKEMYVLAYDVLVFYANRFVDFYYNETSVNRNRQRTFSLKNSYMNGFLDGLKAKFENQFNELKEEYGLMVLALVPVEVDNAYEKMAEDFTTLKHNIPDVENHAVYQQGYEDGNNVDYTKSTIDDEVFV